MGYPLHLHPPQLFSPVPPSACMSDRDKGPAPAPPRPACAPEPLRPHPRPAPTPPAPPPLPRPCPAPPRPRPRPPPPRLRPCPTPALPPPPRVLDPLKPGLCGSQSTWLSLWVWRRVVTGTDMQLCRKDCAAQVKSERNTADPSVLPPRVGNVGKV